MKISCIDGYYNSNSELDFKKIFVFDMEDVNDYLFNDYL